MRMRRKLRVRTVIRRETPKARKSGMEQEADGGMKKTQTRHG
jgi:hypothetical protein